MKIYHTRSFLLELRGHEKGAKIDVSSKSGGAPQKGGVKMKIIGMNK